MKPTYLTLLSTVSLLAHAGRAVAAEPAISPLLSAGTADYARQAAEVTDFIQQTFFLPKRALYAQAKTKRSPELMWGNGVMFPALVAATRHDPKKYGPTLLRFFHALDGFWDSKAPHGGYEPAPTSGNGHDKYYDDNAWMVLTFLEAYDLTGNADFLNHARRTHAFVLSGQDDAIDGGIWWHEAHKDDSKNTCINAPAAVGCFRLARYQAGAEAAESLATGKKLIDWTTTHLQADDGLYFDAIKHNDRKVEKTKWTYNSALMIRAYLEQYRVTRRPEDLAQAVRIGRAAAAFMDEKKNAYRDGFKFTHLLVEADLELFRATGDEALLRRAIANADYAYRTWKAKSPDDLIENASVARMLWLLADMQTEVGLKFWQKADRNPS